MNSVHDNLFCELAPVSARSLKSGSSLSGQGVTYVRIFPNTVPLVSVRR